MINIETMSVSIARLEVKPGDCVVLTSENTLTSEQVACIKECMESRLPMGVGVHILMGGLTLSGVIAAAPGGGSEV